MTPAPTIGTTNDFINTYTWHDFHRLTRIEQGPQSRGSSVSEKRVDLAYNNAGQYTQIDRYEDHAGNDRWRRRRTRTTPPAV